MRILVVEDERTDAEQVINMVESLGGTCTWMTSIDEAENDIIGVEPGYQAVVLDRHLNDGSKDGVELIPRLRKRLCNVPVVIASKLDGDQHRREANKAGADGYIAKPYRSADLEITLRNVMRRYRFNVGALEVDLEHNRAYWDERPLDLPPLSLETLKILMLNADEMVSRMDLSAFLYGSDNLDRARLDVAIRRVRSFLLKNCGVEPIETVVSEGFILHSEPLKKPN